MNPECIYFCAGFGGGRGCPEPINCKLKSYFPATLSNCVMQTGRNVVLCNEVIIVVGQVHYLELLLCAFVRTDHIIFKILVIFLKGV